MMSQSKPTREWDEFPWSILLLSIIIWITPVFIAAALTLPYFNVSNVLSVTLLLILTSSVPVFAVLLHYIDTKRGNSYISIWGYR